MDDFHDHPLPPYTAPPPIYSRPGDPVDIGALWRLIARCSPDHPEYNVRLHAAASNAMRHAADGKDAAVKRWGVEAITISLLIDRRQLGWGLEADHEKAREDAEDLMGYFPYGRIPENRPLFDIGELRIHAALMATLDTDGVVGIGVLAARHQRGDWGSVDEAEDGNNHWCVQNGYTVGSLYQLPDGRTVYLVTEADRSVTTALLPEDF